MRLQMQLTTPTKTNLIAMVAIQMMTKLMATLMLEPTTMIMLVVIIATTLLVRKKVTIVVVFAESVVTSSADILPMNTLRLGTSRSTQRCVGADTCDDD